MVLNDFYEWRFQPLLVPPPTLQEDMRNLVNNRELSDVTFIVDGFPVYASRVHLALRSEHFRAMLYGGMRESEKGAEIEIKVSGDLVFLVGLVDWFVEHSSFLRSFFFFFFLVFDRFFMFSWGLIGGCVFVFRLFDD